MKATRSLLLFLGSFAAAAAAPLDMKPIATLPLAGAEISAYDSNSKRLFVTADIGLQIIDLTDPTNPQLLGVINFTTLGLPGTDVTSVSVHGGVAAVALPDPVKTNPGRVAFVQASTGTLLSSVQVGSLPDALTFSADGGKVLVANEGEIAAGVDPADDTVMGTVSIIDVSGGFASPTVQTADFTSFDTPQAIQQLRDAGVRIYNGAKPSTDFEPEYVAVSPDGTKAMVTLQEANAVALLDIATASFTDVVALGEQDFSGLLADFSDRDGEGNTAAIKLTRGNPVFGQRMPDAIASFVGNDGETYYVIANEGDDRNDFLNTPETTNLANSAYVLDEIDFPNAAELKTNARLGRMTVSNAPGLRGDTNGDGKINRILALGGRSISILDAQGNLVNDSRDIMERGIASLGMPWFDDGRSRSKGPEPEGVTIGSIGGRTYGFVALERSRGVMAFDLTNPLEIKPAGFATRADGSDRNPEDITFIPAADSPNGINLIAVTNESSNTLTLYSVEPVDYTLQLLHFADAEAGLLASQTAPNLAALVQGFEGTHPNTLIISGGDSFIPGPFLNAGTDPTITPVLRTVLGNPALSTAFGRPDIALHNIIGVEVSAIGNHEFDLGSNVFSDAIAAAPNWTGAEFVHVSANLAFSGDPLNAIFNDVPLDGSATAIPDASTRKGRIVPVTTLMKGGEKIGFVGATTQVLESISSPTAARVKGFDEPRSGVNDMDLLASQLQPYINELVAEGVDKIILVSHLQQLENEQLLATKLNGVDIILAAGSNTRVGDADDSPVAFPGHGANFAGPYPMVRSAADGKPVLIVNTDNEFTYLGRLVVDFDAQGQVIVPNIAVRSAENGAWAATEQNVAAVWGVESSQLGSTAFAAGTKGARVKAITDAVQGVINAKDGVIFGFTDVYLEGERIFVRNQETNLGNITADANGRTLQRILPAGAAVASLKNSGGIRAQIGAVTNNNGVVSKLPPLANPAAGKPAGGVSKLDIENALRFNNRLMAFETTPAGLKAILEHGVALTPNQGRFPQVGGLAFAWDPALPANARVTSISLLGPDGEVAAAVYRDGAFLEGAPAVIHMVTLNFLANGGDSYPMKANGTNFRYILNDNTLSAVVDPALNFTAPEVLPANTIGEQQTFEEYLSELHPSLSKAYATADTPIELDTRIQRLDRRADTVLAYSPEQMRLINSFTTAFLQQGLSASVVVTNLTMSDSIAGVRQQGRQEGNQEILANPAAFNLFPAQGLRIDGQFVEFGENARIDFRLQSSDDLADWADEALVPDVEVDLSGPRKFFRFSAEPADSGN